MSQLTINKQDSNLIVNGLAEALCDDAMVHAEKIVTGPGVATYKVHVQAYLPKLEANFPAPQIDISEDTSTINFELIEGSFTARTVKVIYTSQAEGTAPYSLWAFDIEYSMAVTGEMHQAEFLKIVLHNTDPETTRGTVTTVDDPD